MSGTDHVRTALMSGWRCAPGASRLRRAGSRRVHPEHARCPKASPSGGSGRFHAGRRDASRTLMRPACAFDPVKTQKSKEDTGQASRGISTARLHVLPRFHLPPINVIVSHVPSGALRPGSAHLEVGFPLRCFQRLSRPDVATRRCPWRDNRYTSGRSIPVLSY